MYEASISIPSLASSIWSHRDLLVSLTRREVLGRYRGSIVGIGWAVVLPLLLLCVYTFVFGIVFRFRWTPGTESMAEFALIVFAGVLLFNVFSECVNRAPGLILNHPGYVKKIIFPLEFLPLVSLGSALFHLAVSLAVWIAFYALLIGFPHSTILLLPIALLPLVLATLGLSWFLAALGVYLRDLAHIVNVATSALMFLSPVFYPVTAVPPKYRFVVLSNPLTPAIEQARALMIRGQANFDAAFFAQTVGAAAIAWLGFAWFQKTRKGFADVI